MDKERFIATVIPLREKLMFFARRYSDGEEDAQDVLQEVFAKLWVIREELHKYDPYEGSYMVINGKKIYNTELIKQQETEIRKMDAEREKEYRQIYEQSEIKTNEIRDILMVKNK